MMAVERQYAALKILWQWHDSEKFPDFVALVAPAQQGAAQPGSVTPGGPVPAPPPLNIDDGVLHCLFQLADENTWELLKDAAGNKTLTIVPPRSDGSQPLEAYDALRFDIQTGNHRIETAFLFKHALRFDWTIKLVDDRRWMRLRRPSKPLWLTPRTSEPRVVQYVPRAATVTVEVKITNANSETITVGTMDGGPLVIAASSDFGTFRGLAKVEKISWALAAIVAVVTGLSMFYFKVSTFGSFQDYLTLFLWGAGVDSGKNFLQALQSYSATPPKAS
jgi:hypothetical protein